MIKTKRVYETYAAEDGFRILVDRLWPRGLKKESAHADIWMKEIAPSAELRKRFHQGAASYEAFEEQYRKELEENPHTEELLNACKQNATVTLLFASKDREHNNAEILRKVLNEALRVK